MNSSATTVAGYTGVTASGTGYTGTVPVVAAPSAAASAADYDAVVADDAVNYTATSAYPVTAQRVVFTEEEGEIFVAPAEAEVTRYALEHDIGPTSDLVTPESAMAIMKDSPNVVFPFEVQGLRGERTIEVDRTYNLNNVRTPGDDENPVEVVQSDATSFTFLTLPGHFRGSGRTIRFVTLERDGRLILRQEGTSSAGIIDELYDAGARISWRYQANNLRAAIYGGVREDFPGTFPVFW
jgi:hypothetical protein